MEIGDRRRQGIYIGYVGLLHHQRSEIESAVAHYVQAIRMAREVGDRRTEAFFLAWLGAGEAELDRVDEAQTSLAVATQQLTNLGDSSRAAVASLLHAHVDLALARKLSKLGDKRKAEMHIRAARHRIQIASAPNPPALHSLAERSDEVRLAIRLIQRALPA